MIEIISNKIVSNFNKHLVLSSDDQAKMKYVLDVILGDFSKLIIMFILFFLFDKHIIYIHAVIVSSLLRIFTGGLHFKTYFGCLVFSTSFFTICILIIDNISTFDIRLVLLLYILSISIIILLAPIQSSTRPLYLKKARLIFKINALLVVTIHFIGYFIANNNRYFLTSISVLLLQTLQLLIAKRRWGYDSKITKENV